MKMIESLTPDQEALMDEVADQYEKNALSGKTEVDLGECKRAFEMVYAWSDLKPPKIILCESAIDLFNKAGLVEGEQFDSFGIGYDSGWTAFYDYMERIGVEYDKTIPFTEWKNFILNSGVFCCVMRERAVYICPRPYEVHRNSEFRLHNPSGMAIKWENGEGWYFLNGVRVTEKIVMTPSEELDVNMIVKETNAEVRRELVRKIGIERYIVKNGAKLLDKEVVTIPQSCIKGIIYPSSSHEYELLEIDLNDGRRRPYLKMKNPSIGTWHVEGVPPGTRTVKEALSFRNGTDETPAILT